MTGSDRYQHLRDAIAAGPTPGKRTLLDSCIGTPLLTVTDDDEWHHQTWYVMALGKVRICDVQYQTATKKGFQGVGKHSEARANADLAAAADPETIAALLAERDALREACAAMVEWDDRENDHAVDFSARQDLCRAAFDKARSALSMGGDHASL